MAYEGYFLKRFDATLMRGMLRIMVLAHLKKHGAHPYAMLLHFREKGLPGAQKLKKSDIYNTIRNLEAGVGKEIVIYSKVAPFNPLLFALELGVPAAIVCAGVGYYVLRVRKKKGPERGSNPAKHDKAEHEKQA